MAELQDATITMSELEDHIAGELVALRREEYELRRNGIRELVAERLLDREATRRGISKDELYAIEVEDKTPEPTPAEIEAFYVRNRSRLGGQEMAAVRPQIKAMLRRQAAAGRARAFHQELEVQAGLRILLAPPRSEVPIPSTAPTIGPTDAPVVMVEFTDYQCPFCMRAQRTVEQILERYQGKLRLVYRDLPLEMHKRAFAASRAARCAGEQNLFWEYHRNLLTKSGGFEDDDLKVRAAELGLDGASFESCLGSTRHDAAIQASLDDASKLGVTSSPTFFINGRQLTGAQPFEDFASIIDEELADAGS